jgi:hypothetical protein
MKFSHALFYPCMAAVLVCVSGCNDKDEIKVYRVSKENPAPENPAMPGMEPMGGPMAGGAQPSLAAEPAPGIADTAPSGWVSQPPSSMRQASYLVKGDNGATADVSLVTLGGSAGGILDNVNRWLGQIGQPAISEEKLAQMVQKVSSPLGDVSVVDLEGLPTGGDAMKDGRILAGIASDGSRTFFFKMRGNAALVEAQKEAFIQWIGSVRPSEAVANPMPSAPVVSAPVQAPALEKEKPQIKWEVPKGWKSAPPSSMRYASFTVAGPGGGTADVSVSVFAGNGGGDLGNVNRWRGQAGLQPVAEGDLKSLIVPLKTKDGDVLTVDLLGPTTHIVAGWAEIDGRSWFFKITGSDAVIAGEKEKFVKFLQSVQFHP